MPSKRNRIVRFPIEVTPRAIEIWTQMWKLERSRTPDWEQWWKLDNELSLELHCKPWEVPCTIHPDDATAPDNKFSRIMKHRWSALDAARRDAQRLKRQTIISSV